MKKGSILIVDDNKNILSTLEILLHNEYQTVKAISNPNRINSLLQNEDFDLILLDMNFAAGVNTGNEGLYWLKEIRQQNHDIEIVLFTAYGDVELAVKALKLGAADFILKPWDNEKLKVTLRNVYRLQQSKKEIKELKQKQSALKQEINKKPNLIIAQSPQMLKILKMVHKVAQTDANVLITGENGTGKDLIAKELHRQSGRSEEIMVSVDMGAISETLFESELFGHIKGAFTDAREDRIGKIENAHKGTLFLDEIGNLPVQMQSKLLSVLQNRTVTRIGSNKPVPVDIRLICSTNSNLPKMVQECSFREDLLYRINTIHIEIPPLRERVKDIIALSAFFLKIYSAKYKKPCTGISEQAMEKLKNYHWPGNIRELQHTIEKTVILCDRTILKPDDFFFNATSAIADNMFEGTLDEMEKRMVVRAISDNPDNMTSAARQLGITRQTLYNKMKKYNL